MAYTDIPPSTAGSTGSASVAFARAQSLLGAANITKVLGDDFGNDQWYRAIIAGTGTVAQSVTERGGVITLDTGATNSAFAVLYPHGTTTVHIGNPQTQRWYIRCRMKITTAVDAQALCYAGFATAGGGNPLLDIGVIGSLSTAFISTKVTTNAGAATSTTSTVAVDTAYHVVEAWGDTTTVTAAWDGVSIFTTAVANVGTSPVTPTAVAGNGTTNAVRTVLCDYLYTCVGDP